VTALRLQTIALSLAIAVVVCFGARAIAASPVPSAEQLKEAKTRYERGRALYTLGQYAEAIREFSAGYVVVPKPQFLLNLGQCHRKLGELVKAREMYQKFLDEAPAAPERPQVTGLIADLDREIAAADAERAARERAERERVERERAERERAAATKPTPTVAPATTSASTATTERAPRRRLWIIPVVLGAVAVVGVAVGVGVWAGTRGPDGPRCGDPGVLGCVDATTQALSIRF